jgi:Flp pilus assembly protein TadG
MPTETTRPASQAGARNGRREHGFASLELAVLAPAIILLTFAVVQAALAGYAHSVARTAAEAGVTAARSSSVPAAGASSEGIAQARAVLAGQASGVLQDAVVSDAGSTPGAVRLTVSGRSVCVIPGLPGFSIEETAEAPREQFTVPGGTP